MERPSTALLESVYNDLFHTPLGRLIQSALHGKLFHGEQKEEGVAGRSMAWKIFLSRQPPLTSALNPNPIPPLEALHYSREHYVSLLREKMRAPDGSYQEGLQIPGDSTPTSSAPRKPDDWNLNNPLSLDSSNPWHAYFSALESQNTIRQDVERTFPEIPYYRSTAVQSEMTHILFLHASENEHVGYRQGMHELLACVYRALDFDSVERSRSPQVNPQLQELCDRTYVAADAYALFGSIMQRIETWYEWRAPISDPISPASPVPHVSQSLANGEIVSPLNPQVNILANGQLDLKKYVAPIIPTCVSLRDEKLRVVDPHLWEKLHEVGVEAQMYGMRWLRLLFTREFSLEESMVIWDGLFASVATDPISPSSSSFSQQGFELALWISVAMLIRIRNSLIPGDYHTQLTHLLRYPNPRSLGASQISGNAPGLLLSQAQLLLMSPTPGTGVALVMQNRNELGIPVEIPDSSPRAPHRRRASGVAATFPQMASQGKAGHERPKLQDMITSRIMDANETLGIQRGFLNTISELRKNLPDISQTLIRTPTWNGSPISLVDERLNEAARNSSFTSSDGDERISWQPRSRSDTERELSELRILLKSLGDAVGWAVDVLLLDDDGSKDAKEGEKTLQERKAEAVQCMAYVRDVLSRGGKGGIDEERLLGEERKRQQRNYEKEGSSTLENRHSPSSKPATIPTGVVASATTTLRATSKPHSAPIATSPISSLTKTPIPLTSHGLASSTPLASFSSRANQAPQPRLKALMAKTPGSEPKHVIQPWELAPSKFSGDSPYANESLYRLPSSSTTHSRDSADDHNSISRVSPSTAEPPPPELPHADPLGVLR